MLLVNFPTDPNYHTAECYNTQEIPISTAHEILVQFKRLETENPYFHLYDAYLDGQHDYTGAEAFDVGHLNGIGAEKMSTRVDSVIGAILKLNVSE